jgi:hypothetical protein
VSVAAAATRGTGRGWRGDVLTALLWGGAIFAVTLLPYIYAYATTPSGKVFNGFFFIADDAATYISKMREGAEGAWGWSDRYITTPVARPVVLFLFYIAWGKLAALLHLPLVAAYHLARLSGAVALVYAARALARAVLPEASRGLAVLIALLGSGAGYLLLVFNSLLGSGVVLGSRLEALDLHLPELSAIYSVIAIPHFAWAAALMAMSVIQLMAIARAPDRGAVVRPVVLASIALVALCLIHPQMLFVLAPLAGLYLAMVRPSPLAWLATAVPFLVCLPLLVYFLSVLDGDPVIVAWSHQWKHQAPGFVSLVFGLGLPLAFAVYAIARGAHRHSPELALMAAWLLLVVALLYIPNPVNIQRRLIDGLYLPEAMLAAVGVGMLAEGWRRRRARRRLVFSVVAVSAVSSLVVIGLAFRFAAVREPIIYIDQGEMDAFTWLAGQRGTGTPPGVLSEAETGLYIPEMAGLRVYVGHYSETIDYLVRARLARDAIRAGTPSVVAFMAGNDVAYLVVGPRERALGVGVVGPQLAKVYDAGDVEVYRLQLPAPGP